MSGSMRVPRLEVAARSVIRASILRVDTNLVLVPVTVNDAMNRTVTNLNKQNFELYEAGKQQKILYFSTEDSPISVGILLGL